MELGQTISNVELGNFYVSMLRSLRAPDPKFTMDAILRQEFPNGFVSRFTPKAGNTPAWYTGGDNFRRLFFIDGVTTQAQSDFFCGAYNDGYGPTTTNGINRALRDTADRIIQVNANFRLDTPDATDVVGYSMGGAIGTWMVKRWVDAEYKTVKRLASFGAPRALNRDHVQGIINVPIVRWMCDADPIPLVHLRVEDFPLLFVHLGGLAAQRIQSYAHTHGGVSIDGTGNITTAILPPIAVANPITSLASWFFQIEGEANNPHALNTYGSRFLQFLVRHPNPAEGGIGGGGDEEPNAVHRRGAQRQIDGTATTIQNASTEQNQIAVQVDEAVLFKARRFGRVWAVTLGDTLFTYSGNKKRARHLARAGNDFLRSMPKQAVVDPQGLLDQLTNFFNAAVVPGGPVNPPIRISLD